MDREIDVVDYGMLSIGRFGRDGVVEVVVVIIVSVVSRFMLGLELLLSV